MPSSADCLWLILVLLIFLGFLWPVFALCLILPSGGIGKGAFLIEAKQLVFCEVIFVYFWNYFHANVWQNVKDLTPYFDRHIY